MKKLLALGCLLTASGLIADQNNNGSMNNGTYQNNNCCPSDCCKPCCVPKPKKCVDCECYTPHFYELQCDWGVSVDIEFLYWYAREGDLAYAVKAQAVNPVPGDATRAVLEPRKFKHLKTNWDPGFRVGLGWNSECDGWDVYLTWTYYHNKKRSSTSVPNFAGSENVFFPGIGQEAIADTWTNPTVVAIATENPRLLYDTVTAKWRLNMNWIDLELGRKYWLSRYFTMRPYTALRGQWTRTSFRNNASRTTGVGFQASSFKDRFTTRQWGVGFLVGIQPEWYFTRCFVLYTNFDAALTWGDTKVRKHEHYTSTTVDNAAEIGYHNHTRNNFAKMQSIIDLAIGLRWEDTWCCDRYRTALDVGWEHHIWFDMNNRTKILNTTQATSGGVTQFGFQGYEEVHSNLMFGGLVVRLRIDF